MNYLEVLIKLNKLKKIIFFIFLILIAIGYLLQKNNAKKYELFVDIYFPEGSFLPFQAKNEIYENFKNSTITELVQKEYVVKKKPILENAYRISTILKGDKNELYLKKKNEIKDVFKRQKKKLILWISNNYNATKIGLENLSEDEITLDSKRLQLELKWMELEKEFVYENVSEINVLKFPKELVPVKRINYYAIMMVLFIAILTFFITYLIIIDDINKKMKRFKRLNKNKSRD